MICNLFQSTLCSPFTSLKLSSAISQLSNSMFSGPDRIIYRLLTHFPQSGLQLVLHIFNLPWSTHTFIVPILKSEKLSDSPSSYRLFSLISCTSKLFERIVLGQLTHFLENNHILIPVQAGFRPGRSIVDQDLLLSQSSQIFLKQAHVLSSPLWIWQKLLTQSGILLFSRSSFLLGFCSI